MIKIISRVTDSTKGNIINIRAKIAVDSAADLAANLNNYYFALGSIAWDVSTGDIYGIDSCRYALDRVINSRRYSA